MRQAARELHCPRYSPAFFAPPRCSYLRGPESSLKPLSKDDVINLLKGDVPARRVEALVREHGIDFQITPETESELRKAGATDPLLAVLRDLGPKPPTLVVTTAPGGAQVFVDDELIASTSAEGRLKISTLAAGPHKLRVSSDGYRDHEERVDLVAGETLGVPIPLEPNTQTSPPAAPSAGLGARGATSPSGSVEENTLTLPGRIHGPHFWDDGTITVGNGKLQFRSTQPEKYSHSFEVDLRSVVAQVHYKSSVDFYVQRLDKKRATLFGST